MEVREGVEERERIKPYPPPSSSTLPTPLCGRGRVGGRGEEGGGLRRRKDDHKHPGLCIKGREPSYKDNYNT